MRDAVELEIEGLTDKGKGLATVTGPGGCPWPVEASGVYPGERIRAQLPKRRRGRYTLWDYELITPAEQRRQARCQHAGLCGGCRWQTLGYTAQLAWKQQRIERLFGVHAREIRPILPCDPPWQYRNKMEYSFSADAAGRRFLGLMVLEGRGRVVNLQECHLAAPWFIRALSAVRSWWESGDLTAYHPPKDRGVLRRLTLREAIATGDRLAILTVSGNPDYPMPGREVQRFVDCLRPAAESVDGNLSIILSVQKIAKGRPTRFYSSPVFGKGYLDDELRIPGKRPLSLRVSPEAFLQPNSLQVHKLYALSLELAQLKPGDNVLDLCCGTGTLALLAALTAKRVTGVEICEEAVLDARGNAEANNLENVDFIAGDLKIALNRCSNLCPHVIFVDPPRAGLEDQVLRMIAAIKAERIVYISCNPVTQARDIGRLREAGYVLEVVQPLDQFPHTPHTENIAALRRVAGIPGTGL